MEQYEWSLTPRLRHVKTVMCRNLQVEGMSSLPSLRCWFELWVAPDDTHNTTTNNRQLLYISEKVTGTLNPEWTKLQFKNHNNLERLISARFVVKAQEQRSDPIRGNMRYVPEFDNDWDDYSQLTVGSKIGKPSYLSLQQNQKLIKKNISKSEVQQKPKENSDKNDSKQIKNGSKSQGYFSGLNLNLTNKKSVNNNNNNINNLSSNGFDKTRNELVINSDNEIGFLSDQLNKKKSEISKRGFSKLTPRKTIRQSLEIESKEIYLEFEYEQILDQETNALTQKIHIFFRYSSYPLSVDSMLSPLSKSFSSVDPILNLRLRQAPLTLIDQWIDFADLIDMGQISLGGFTGVFQPNSLVFKIGKKLFTNERPWIGATTRGGYDASNIWYVAIQGKKPGAALSERGVILSTPRKKLKHRRTVAKTQSFIADIEASKHHARVASRGGHTRNPSGTSIYPCEFEGVYSAFNGSPPVSLFAPEIQGTSENKSEVSGGQEGGSSTEIHGGEAKRYEDEDFIMEIRKIKECHNYLINKEKRRDAVMEQLEQALLQSNKVKQQQLQLERKKEQLIQLKERTKQMQIQIQMQQKEVKLRQAIQTRQCVALKSVLDVLIDAAQWMDKQQVEVVQKLETTCTQHHTMIVDRRCDMMMDLAHIFRVGPKPLSVWQGPSWEESLDKWWMLPIKTKSKTEPAPVQLPANSVANSWKEEVKVMSNLANVQSEGVDLGIQYKQVELLTISGLQWDQRLVNLARDNIVLQDQKVVQKTAAVLGYIVHLVNKLADYLAVPLRYPLVYMGSRSFIVDPAPPVQEAKMWIQQHNPSDSKKIAKYPQIRYLNSHRKHRQLLQIQSVTSWAQNHNISEEDNNSDYITYDAVYFPLYYVPRKGMHFDYAIFKLNTDIEQLLFLYGMTSESPMKALQNLHKLFEHAKSGSPT